MQIKYHLNNLDVVNKVKRYLQNEFRMKIKLKIDTTIILDYTNSVIRIGKIICHRHQERLGIMEEILDSYIGLKTEI